MSKQGVPLAVCPVLSDGYGAAIVFPFRPVAGTAIQALPIPLRRLVFYCSLRRKRPLLRAVIATGRDSTRCAPANTGAAKGMMIDWPPKRWEMAGAYTKRSRTWQRNRISERRRRQMRRLYGRYLLYGANGDHLRIRCAERSGVRAADCADTVAISLSRPGLRR